MFFFFFFGGGGVEVDQGKRGTGGESERETERERKIERLFERSRLISFPEINLKGRKYGFLLPEDTVKLLYLSNVKN